MVASGAFFAIPLITNLALWLRVVPRFLNTDSAAMSYGFAWAPWPTRLNFHHLVIVGEDPNIQFVVSIDEVGLTLDLWSAVSKRTIEITRLRGSGASVRGVRRLQPWAVDAAKVRALPDIPGHPKPPLTDAYVPSPPPTRENYTDTSLEVSDIDATVKELWIDETRYSGQAHVVGAFLFRPRLELRVGPGAAVQFQNGELAVAGKSALTAMSGRAECSTPHFNPVEPEGMAILSFFSGSLEVRANVVNAEFANYFLASSGVKLEGGAGRFKLAFGFERGILRPGTALEISSLKLEAQAAHTLLRTSLVMTGAVDSASHGVVHLTTSELSLSPSGEGARLSGGKLVADIRSGAVIDLSKPAPRLAYDATLSPVSGDAAVVRAYLPKGSPVALDEGTLTLGGHVSGTLTEPDLRAELQMRAELEAHVGKRRFAGKLDARGVLAETREGIAFDKTRLDVSDLMVAQGQDVTYGWWSHLEVVSGGYVKGDSPHWDLELGGLLRDIEPLFVAFGKDIGVPAWVQAFLPLPGTSFRGKLATLAGGVTVDHFRAKSGVVEVRLKVEKPAGEEPTGAVKVASGPLSFGVAFVPQHTSTRILATDAWFDEQE